MLKADLFNMLSLHPSNPMEAAFSDNKVSSSSNCLQYRLSFGSSMCGAVSEGLFDRFARRHRRHLAYPCVISTSWWKGIMSNCYAFSGNGILITFESSNANVYICMHASVFVCRVSDEIPAKPRQKHFPDIVYAKPCRCPWGFQTLPASFQADKDWRLSKRRKTSKFS